MLRSYRRSDFSLRIIRLYKESRGRVFQVAGKKSHFREMWLNSMRISERGARSEGGKHGLQYSLVLLILV